MKEEDEDTRVLPVQLIGTIKPELLVTRRLETETAGTSAVLTALYSVQCK